MSEIHFPCGRPVRKELGETLTVSVTVMAREEMELQGRVREWLEYSPIHVVSPGLHRLHFSYVVRSKGWARHQLLSLRPEPRVIDECDIYVQ